MLRFLRIAVSALFLVGYILLIVLWIRSYYWRDEVRWNCVPSRSIVVAFDSLHGKIGFRVYSWPYAGPRWEVHSSWFYRVKGETFFTQRVPSILGFGFRATSKDIAVVVPYWFLVFLSAALAFALWHKYKKKWQFSLRELLIAMTVVAVVLGLIVVLAR